ncbi:MAG TPA: zinc-dependent peptidase [Vicinamibacterales bacterium]
MKDALKQLAQSLLHRLARPSARLRRLRQAALAAPFPRRWRDVLRARCRHYERLSPLLQTRFRQQVQVFLTEKKVTGVEMRVNAEMRVLVAASAVSLSVGWPDYTWDQLAEVLLYPDNFDRDYNFGGTDISGQAHPWGIVILSAPALNRSFEEASHSFHVGFHEFAHLLDLMQTQFDGIPAGLSDDSIRRWLAIVDDEQRRLRRGDSILDPYALTGTVEFFPTAVEAFFQMPVRLADSHAALYDFLSSYFAQDPASWDRATGS